MANEGLLSLVIDNGSGITKAGFSGDDAPRAVFPTIVGKPKTPGIMVGLDQKDVYVGAEANDKRTVLNISYPIKQGLIQDWESIEDIWFHTISTELKVPPDQHPILISEPPLNPKDKREKTTTTMFEEFKVQGLYLGIQAVLALFACGKTTGIVLDSGDGITHAVPIYEGYAIPHAIKPIRLAGSDLTNFLIKLLAKRGIVLNTPSEIERARELKEKYCMVAQEYDQQTKDDENKAIASLPDGNMISSFKDKSQKEIVLGKERFTCPELLFQPSIDVKDENDKKSTFESKDERKQDDKPQDGIHKITHDAINSCDNDIRKDLYKNIVLSGGNTMFPGISDRMTKEIKALAPASMQPMVVASAERKYMVWVGGSILSSLNTFNHMFVTRAEYQENGPNIIHRKCF